MRSIYERSLEVAAALCARVEELMGDVPLAYWAMEFIS